ncbi:prepilin-type N-terminal cleavage/methylation domain-containing protein [Marinobacterium arenosum]|uniref:prepilin-type N-terminal cleavage/methylation domain-containing protein n=1 Tax=Marinobacterium arenosum TaxID=2862496 RepID=UPI001C962E45|nr:prepilin-type N-terminal cleavage/methylation domain-containing protein [Marinobacterium arenosum]MBY4678236.1 prepilin-type N-terminal cleavage/methylation domain-containing protein [Marinobacterium arenosum]
MNGRQPVNKQAGLSLIELLISVTLGAIVLAGVINVFAATVGGSKDLLEQARLEQELNAILLWMSDDIRRAGYWGPEALQVDWGNGDRNPFIDGIQLPSVDELAGEAANSCVLYSYNLDEDSDLTDSAADDARIGVCSGCVPTAAPFNDATLYDTDGLEMFGYRLNSGAVEVRTGLASAAEATFSCNSGSWTQLSDPSMVTISALSFAWTTQNLTALTVTSDAGVNTAMNIESWQLTIQLTGQLVSDNSITKTLNTTVKLANNVVRE